MVETRQMFGQPGDLECGGGVEHGDLDALPLSSALPGVEAHEDGLGEGVARHGVQLGVMAVSLSGPAARALSRPAPAQGLDHVVSGAVTGPRSGSSKAGAPHVEQPGVE